MNLTFLRKSGIKSHTSTFSFLSVFSTKVILVMKLTAFFMLIALVQISAKGYTQTVTLSRHNITLEKVFKIIQRQTGYNFIGTLERLSGARKVDLDVKDAPLESVLDLCFKDQPLTYTIVEKTIVVRPNRSSNNNEMTPALLTPVSGTVTDSVTGQSMPGVTIQVKDNATGTITDNNGNFQLDVPDGAVLVLSYIGYEKKEVPVNGKTAVHISLVPLTTGLDQLVIVGYGTEKKVNLTGAVSAVQMSDVIGDRPIDNASKALQGIVPGLQVTYGSGQPGKGVDMNIRGFESINGGKPLVLVDNVPTDIEDINPKDIKEVSVLKDASASAIYGARAAFGVILITTKKGSFNQPVRFDYSATVGFNHPEYLPRKSSQLEYIQALQSWGETTEYQGFNLETWKNLLLDYQKNPSSYPEGYADYQDGLRYWLIENDVLKDLMSDKGLAEQVHNFSFSGGSKDVSYRASFGYRDEDGIMVTSKDRSKRYNALLSLKTKLTSKLTTSLDVGYLNYYNSYPFNDAYYGLFYRAVLYTAARPISGMAETKSGEMVPYKTPANEVRYTPAKKANDQKISLSARASYSLLDNLELEAEFTFEKMDSRTENNVYQPVLMDAQKMAADQPDPTSTSYSLGHSLFNHKVFNIYGKYHVGFGSHKFSLLLGMNEETMVNEGLSASITNLISPNKVPGLGNATGNKSVGNSYTDFGVVGFFGRFQYNFKDKYLLEVNSRYDGSSRFPPGHRFGFFPSVSAGWKVTSEPFMDGFKILSLLKPRISWGSIGNQDISNYAYFATMNVTNPAWINHSTGEQAVSFSVPGLVSDNFTWETVQTLNAGIDIALWNDRLYATFDWYNRKTLNMLAPGMELPAILGASAPLQNTADLSTKGWELDIQWKDQIGGFNYSVGFNLYDNQTKITDYDNKAGLISQYYVGQKIGEIWGYVTDGFFTTDDFEKGTLDENIKGGTLKAGIPAFEGEKPNPGDVKYKDLNDDGKISPGARTLDDPGDRKIIGNNTRRYQMGFHGAVSYKNVDLSFYLQGIGKRDVWLNNNLTFPYMNRFSTIYKNQLDYWTPDNVNAYYPRNYPSAGGNYSVSRQVQTRYLLKGTYLQVKNITAGYTFPQRLLARFGIDKLRIFISAENPMRFDANPPEIQTEASDYGEGGFYPYLQKFTGGINVSF